MSADQLFRGMPLELVVAAEKGDVATVDRLLDGGVGPNVKGRFGTVPLHRAFLAKQKQTYQRLLERGANPNIRDDMGTAVMLFGAAERDSFWLSNALQHGGDANLLSTGNPFDGKWTPLLLAINGYSIENVRLLIAAGADLEHKDSEGRSPLSMAHSRQNFQMAYLLIAAGADPQTKVFNWTNKFWGDSEYEETRLWWGKLCTLLKEKFPDK